MLCLLPIGSNPGYNKHNKFTFTVLNKASRDWKTGGSQPEMWFDRSDNPSSTLVEINQILINDNSTI